MNFEECRTTTTQDIEQEKPGFQQKKLTHSHTQSVSDTATMVHETSMKSPVSNLQVLEHSADYSTTDEDLQTEFEEQNIRTPVTVRRKVSRRTRLPARNTVPETQTLGVTRTEPAVIENTTARPTLAEQGVMGSMKEFMDQVTNTMKAMQAMMEVTTNTMKTVESKSQHNDAMYENTNNHHRAEKVQSRTTTSNYVSSDSEIEGQGRKPAVSRSSNGSSTRTSQIITARASKSTTIQNKLPAYTGTEKWKVWFNRFESVAKLAEWTDNEKLQQILPRIQGTAADFVFGQLPESTLSDYQKLVREIEGRFDTIESSRTYKTKFSHRNQENGESVEEYSAELKRLYDKAHPNRDTAIRQEDLVTRFLFGLKDENARKHVELNREPRTIEEAVHHVVTYQEISSNNRQDQGRQQKSIRQTKPSRNNKGKDGNNYKGNNGDGGSTQTNFQQRSKGPYNEKHAENEKSDMICVSSEKLQEMIQNAVRCQQTTGNQNVTGRGHNQYEPLNNKRKNIQCYKCKEFGHFARECTSQISADGSTTGYGQWNYDQNQGVPKKTSTGTRPDYQNQGSSLSPHARAYQPPTMNQTFTFNTQMQQPLNGKGSAQ